MVSIILSQPLSIILKDHLIFSIFSFHKSICRTYIFYIQPPPLYLKACYKNIDWYYVHYPIKILVKRTTELTPLLCTLMNDENNE